jgi:hypothetical protein
MDTPAQGRPKLFPGMKLLWCADLERWDPAEVIIDGVGRKYATIINGWPGLRVSIETWDLEGRSAVFGYATGKLWESENQWKQASDAEQARRAGNAAWEAFRGAVGYCRPEHLDAATINEMTAKMKGSP